MNGSKKFQEVALPLAAVFAAMAALQIGVATAKSVFPVIGPFATAGLRLSFAALLLIAALRPWRHWPEKAPLVPLICLGLTMGLQGLVGYQALARLPVGVVITIQFLGPIGVAIVGSRRPVDFLWIALALGGVWALVWRGVAVGDLNPLGLLLAGVGACCWATHIVLGRRVSRAYGPATSALTMSMAAAIVLPVGVAHLDPSTLTLAVLATVGMVALFSTAIPYALEFYAMARMPAKTFSVISCVEPAFAALAGLLILGEGLTALQVGGLVAVVAAATGAILSAEA